jgi:hypothetical protein
MLTFTLNLPWTTGRRDFGRVEGLLGYICDRVNAHRRSSIVGAEVLPGLAELQRRGDELTALLRSAVEGGLDNPSDEFLTDIRARFRESVPWDQQLERARGGAAFRFSARVDGGDGLYALLAVLLMHPKYRQLIRRCPECGKYFIRAGKRLFCSPKCARAANDAGVLERQKKQRMRRGAAELLLPHFASLDKVSAAVRQAHREHPTVETREQLAAYAKARLQSSRKHK